jgi:nicotinate-nucleotide adenylyltransferase
MTGRNACPTMDQRKRIAIYGGTFDPVHAGHLAIARRVSELFAVDEFLFVPARTAPHKLDREVSSPLHRHAMLALATQADPRLFVSTFELEEPAPQYTVDTLANFRSQWGTRADLFFVMGADSWAELTSWREWERLVTLANLIVVTRPEVAISAANIGPAVAELVVDLRRQTRGNVPPTVEPDNHKIFVTDAVSMDVSATQVRKASRENLSEDLDRLVPVEVANYIRKYRLYRKTNEAKSNC